MDKDQFLGASGETWWLLAPDADYRIAECRDQLGAVLGWTYKEWYSEQNKLEELFQKLQNDASALLAELDYRTDVDQYVGWVSEVIGKLRPPEPPAGPDAGTAESAPEPVAAKKSGGLFGKKSSAPEPEGASEAETAAGEAEAAESASSAGVSPEPEPEPAPQKRPGGLFGSKKTDPAPEPEPASEPEVAPAPVGEAPGEEPVFHAEAEREPEQASEPGPASQAQPEQEPEQEPEPAPAPVGEHNPDETPAPPPAPAPLSDPVEMAAAIKDAISTLADRTGETAAQIADELGLTEEELTHIVEHPDLERLVAEELAQLVGQQA